MFPQHDNKIKQVIFISTSGEPLVNRIHLLDLTLAGPTRNNLVPDPLAVVHLDNWLVIRSFPMSNLSNFETKINLAPKCCLKNARTFFIFETS